MVSYPGDDLMDGEGLIASALRERWGIPILRLMAAKMEMNRYDDMIYESMKGSKASFTGILRRLSLDYGVILCMSWSDAEPESIRRVIAKQICEKYDVPMDLLLHSYCFEPRYARELSEFLENA